MNDYRRLSECGIDAQVGSYSSSSSNSSFTTTWTSSRRHDDVAIAVSLVSRMVVAVLLLHPSMVVCSSSVLFQLRKHTFFSYNNCFENLNGECRLQTIPHIQRVLISQTLQRISASQKKVFRALPEVRLLNPAMASRCDCWSVFLQFLFFILYCLYTLLFFPIPILHRLPLPPSL